MFAYNKNLADAAREGPGEKGLPLAVSKDNEELAKLRVVGNVFGFELIFRMKYIAKMDMTDMLQIRLL